jgi:hypothetical protein
MTQKQPDRGQRPHIDRDGTVHGSGAGAGGGNPGEDYDDDPVGGGGHMPDQDVSAVERSRKEKGLDDKDALESEPTRTAVRNQSQVTPDDYEGASESSGSDDTTDKV